MWYHDKKPVTELPEDCAGFVYVITNITNGKMYIGKKLSRFRTTRYKMHTQKNGFWLARILRVERPTAP